MSAALAIQVRKEARALLPWWLSVAVTTVLIGMLPPRIWNFPDYRYNPDTWGWVVMVYALGILAVAAVSIGHELTHGTLSSLLVQPVSRLKMLATKLGVLIPAIVVLGLVGNAVLLNQYVPASGKPLLIWGPVIAAIGLVPLLTVLTRKPLGGVVFALVVPGVILMVSERLFSLGEGTPVWAITWYGTLAASAIGIAALFYRFPRLEAAGDGGARTVDAVDTIVRSTAGDAAVASTRATPRPWIWLMLKKEVRLQQLTFAVTALAALAFAAFVGAKRMEQDFLRQALETLAGMHACFIVVLAGAFSTAEERQIGTLTPQLLQPQAAWRQFAIKVIATAGLAGALSFGLPLLFNLLGQPVNPFLVDRQFVAPLVLLFCAAVYASSITTNGLWALFATFPVMGVAFAVRILAIDGTRGRFWGSSVDIVVSPLGKMLREWFPMPTGSTIRFQDRPDDFWFLIERIQGYRRDVAVVLAIGLGLFVLYLAYRNYRSLQRGTRVITGQVLMFALYGVFAAVIQFAVFQIGRWWAYRIYG